MRLSGPFRYHSTFDPTRIITVEDSDGVNKFSGPASRRGPKLYVVSHNEKPFYVGVTKQTIRARLRIGFDANVVHGYHGYAWLHHLEHAMLDVWVQDSPDGNIMDLETVESEVVFLIRQEYEQWPAHQTEIHFHPSDAKHRHAARDIIGHYRR